MKFKDIKLSYEEALGLGNQIEKCKLQMMT